MKTIRNLFFELYSRQNPFEAEQTLTSTETSTELDVENPRGFLKEQQEEARRHAMIALDREIERRMNGHCF